MSDLDLYFINQNIIEIAKGDEQSLFSLYNHIGGRLLSIAQAITRDHHLAEDAVQEAMIKVVKYAHTFKVKNNGYGWICTIVRNEALTIIKRENNGDVSLDEFYYLADTIDSAENNEAKVAISIALKKLTPEQRKLIWYKYTCDLNVRDIGAKMGLSKSSVAIKINEAEQRLREFLS